MLGKVFDFMNRYVLKTTACIVGLLLVYTLFGSAIFAAELDISAKSAILIESETGRVLYELNADEALPPASVTKVMTMLLTMEAIDGGKIALTDMVGVSENAGEMGGSQVYLEAGEQMTVEDLLKSVVISSANDAAVALAEYIAGSEEGFVEMMNNRAAELGMQSTYFENTNGLDDTTERHLTSARDIAIMSRELIKNHPTILEYSSIWMDSIRNGEFTLSNTNRLIRFYNGANGLKTGSTSKAKFCISATAQRDGMQLIAVIMGSETRDIRNEMAKKLLDFGFSNYTYASYGGESLPPLPIIGGTVGICGVSYSDFSTLVSKGDDKRIEKSVFCPEKLYAPIREGDKIGVVEYTLDGNIIGSCDIIATETVEKISFFGLFYEMLKKTFQI